MSTAIDPATQARLYHEADARFWGISGYQPGKKLDPHNAVDAIMAPVWQAVYNDVLAQYSAGKLVWTFDQPKTQASIDAASKMSASVEAALDHALSSPPGSAPHGQALQAAGAAHDVAQMHTKAAGISLPSAIVHTSVIAAAPAAHAAAAQAAAHPPPVVTTADVAKTMQLASSPQHAADVAKAHGLVFQMNAAGQGVQVAPSAAPAAPGAADLGPAPAPEMHTMNQWTPLIAVGAVAAALGIGALIQNAAAPKKRRGRIGPRGTFELISPRR
jgi:hypothetical protein